MTKHFPANPNITLFDPLAEMLGVGDGQLEYTFDDAVRLSGHACPTVAGAFLMALHALRALYPEETPRRGGIRVTLPGPVDQGVNGPISQVFTLITGAAADNGFHGLAGQEVRRGLLDVDAGQEGFLFRRLDTGRQVQVRYDASAIPADPEMPPLMQRVLQGEADAAARARFRELWRGRVLAILEDGGENTVHTRLL